MGGRGLTSHRGGGRRLSHVLQVRGYHAGGGRRRGGTNGGLWSQGAQGIQGEAGVRLLRLHRRHRGETD